jgi:hypothetical protein
MASANKLNKVIETMGDPVTLKSIKNYSIQGLYVILNGGEHVWLEPKQIIRVDESEISQQIKNLHRRRIVQISN